MGWQQRIKEEEKFAPGELELPRLIDGFVYNLRTIPTFITAMMRSRNCSEVCSDTQALGCVRLRWTALIPGRGLAPGNRRSQG